MEDPTATQNAEKLAKAKENLVLIEENEEKDVTYNSILFPQHNNILLNYPCQLHNLILAGR